MCAISSCQLSSVFDQKIWHLKEFLARFGTLLAIGFIITLGKLKIITSFVVAFIDLVPWRTDKWSDDRMAALS